MTAQTKPTLSLSTKVLIWMGAIPLVVLPMVGACLDKGHTSLKVAGVDGCFSPTTGAPYGLKDVVADSLRDPDNFEIISGAHDAGSRRFQVNFRGSNGFGGKSLSSLTGTVDVIDADHCRISNVKEDN